MYETHGTGLSRLSWEREMDLQLYQHRQTNRLYRQVRIGAAQRELSRANGERFVAPVYGCVSSADWLRHCSTLQHYSTTVLPNGAPFWYKADDGLWWLGKISARTTIDGEYFLVHFPDGPRPIKLPLSPAHYTKSTEGVQGSLLVPSTPWGWIICTRDSK